MKVIFSGLESAGKSLRLAEEVGELVHRNARWHKRQVLYFEEHGQEKFQRKYERANPGARTIASNLKFSPQFEAHVASLGLPPIVYWENLSDLVKFRDTDIIIDEVGNYFDSRLWSELSLDVRRWLSQGAKIGNEIYGTAQDFAQVDKAFRRLVNHLFLIRKLVGSPRPSATKPPVRRPWGLCIMTELDPQGYDEDKKKMLSGGLQIPSFFWIEKRYCEMFDTTQVINRSKVPPLKHVEYTCEDPVCNFHKTTHV